MTDRRILIEAFQCPVHSEFKALVVNDARFGAGKCCPRQYELQTNEWRLSIGDACDLIETLEVLVERAGARP